MAEEETEVQRYVLQPTSLIPNSPYPLLHYPAFFTSTDPTTIALSAFDLLNENDWQTQWIFRYGPTQPSHYHSRVHECMVVLSGTAKVRFGLEDNAEAKSAEANIDQVEASPRLILDARPGDVFILPAGVAHKTHNVTEGSIFALLTPGDGHSIPVETEAHISGNDEVPTPETRNVLTKIKLDGFTMLGAYPACRAAEWDFAVGGEDTGSFERVWATDIPEKDPVLGNSTQGLRGAWISR